MGGTIAEVEVQAPLQRLTGSEMQLCPPCTDVSWQVLQAMLMQAPELEEGIGVEVRLTVTVTTEVALPSFCMSESGSTAPVPAAGLYYYHTDHAGRLREYVISLDGLPRPTGSLVANDCVVAVWGGCTEPCWSHNWAVKVPGEQEAYLTNVSLGRGEALDTLLDERWLVAMPCERGAAYGLDPFLRATMTNMLFRRYQQGYKAVADWAKAPNPSYHEVNLRANAARFWETCKVVNMGLMRLLGADFDPEPKDRPPNFANPELVFQLSRHLSEGFIEGHAREHIISSGGYAVPEESTRSWGNAIARARRSPGTVNYRSLNGHEKEIFDLICQQFRPESWAMWWRPDAMWWWSITGLLDVVTPGRKVEDIVFWGMHYPHWFADLVYALRELAGADGKGPKLCEQDIEVIAKVIMEAYVATNDSPVTAWADGFALDFGRRIVGRILVALNERAGPGAAD